jgi:ATP/maltotriose-dependent transcriptional regulator MalT
MGGRLHEALEVLQPLLERPDGPELAIACYTAGACLARAGRFAEAVAVTETIGERSTLQAGPSPSMRPSLESIVRCTCLIGAGRLMEAADMASGDHKEGVAVGSMTVQAIFSLFLARAHLAMGDVAAAGRDARDAWNLFREKRWRTLARTALTYVAMSEALGGSAVEARAALAEIDGLGLPADDLTGIEVRRARAWTEVAAGNLAAAHTHLREAAALARYRGDAVWESDVLHDLGRLGWPDEAVARLHELEGEIEGDMIRIRAEHLDALLAEDAEALGRSSGDFEAMGAWLLGAEAAATAAVLLRRGGDPRRAAAAEVRAAALARNCHGAITPALRAVETQALLSAREIEVAALAAAGLANKEIAAKLTVSVRTVENHLQRVYEKLGVARRADLAQALTSV